MAKRLQRLPFLDGFFRLEALRLGKAAGAMAAASGEAAFLVVLCCLRMFEDGKNYQKMMVSKSGIPGISRKGPNFFRHYSM